MPLVILVSLAFAVASVSISARGCATCAPASIIERFLQRDDAPLASYRAVRRLEARNERFKADGWLEAVTELTSDGEFRWEVVAEGGSEHVRSKVLRQALEREAETIRSGKAAAGALTDVNYNFVAGELVDGEQVRIRIHPRRQDLLLVEGQITVSHDNGDLLKIERRLSKNPSFWTRRVDIVRRYLRIAGVRVPVEMTSRAQVRIIGASEFRMTYQYEAINGRDIDAP